jgi:hypothetical protein
MADRASVDSEGNVSICPHRIVVAVQSQEHMVKQEATAVSKLVIANFSGFLSY